MKRLFFSTALLLALSISGAWAAPFFNEIMFHPAGLPEDPAQEWLEISNPDPSAAVDLSGWKLTKGVELTFPAATSVPARGYLVVAANVAAFRTAHPGVANVVGGWVGKLSNSSNTLRLEDPLGAKVAEVSYATEGEWALRARGPVDLAHTGWIWVNPADGGGRSLELRNGALAGFNNGRNWAPSAVAGGTPGALNGQMSIDVAPLISEVKHRPHIPRSSDPIRVSAKIAGEPNESAAVTLRWRLDGSAAFNSLTMIDADGTGEYAATIPAQANNAIVEFYIQAGDTAGNTSAWPAPARTSAEGATPETFAQAANALLQVDNNFNPDTAWSAGAQPIYRVILTAAERAELNQIWTSGTQGESNASFNATLITQDGTGLDTNYFCSIRNRGNGSRNGPPNNALLSFPTDALWRGRKDIAFNCRYAHSQTLGGLLMARMGIAAQDTAAVQVRFNNVNLALATGVMYGTYARVEQLGGDWVKHHFPLDSEGNLYQVRDDIVDPLGGDLRYEGLNPAAYADSYAKQTNSDAADWSDIIRLCDVLNNTPAATYRAAVSQVLDLDQWLTYLAANSLIGNREGGISTGRGDDYSLYRGVTDQRFRLVEHDLDTTMSFGGVTATPTLSIFTPYEGLPGLAKLLADPVIASEYYAKYLDLMDRVYNPTVANPLIDQALGYLAVSQPSAVTAAKNFLVNRRAGVLAQIQQTFAFAVTTGGSDVDGYKSTADGSATFSGTFNVAKTRSALINGVVPTLYYRTNGTNAAGTWRLVVAAGNAFFKPGLNHVSANFYDGPGGTGNLLYTQTLKVYYAAGGGTNVTGTLTPSVAPGSLQMIAPATYIPGVPITVRVDLRDSAGNLDRAAWNSTATLSATGGVTLSPGTVTLTNGMGSALVTVGGGGGATQQLIAPGGTSAAPNANAPQWRILDAGADPGTAWRAETFDDSTWKLGVLQAGAGDGDERTLLSSVTNASATQTRRGFYFRQVFNVANPAAFSTLSIKAVVDDGAIFYLNGTEIYRDGMASGAVAMTTSATANRAGAEESSIRTFDVSAFVNLLKAGANTLAVEVHNYSLGTISTDLSFDCELLAGLPATDPGNLTLSATVGTLTAGKAIASLGTPAMTSVSGTLPGTSTTWSGVINVTADVTVPAGHTLTIAPGTHVLFAGNATAGSNAGSDLIVQGSVAANGTLAQPISMTASTAATRWGEINHTSATASSYRFCLVSHAAHSPGGGHTGTGPMVRAAGTALTFEDCVLSDSPGKVLLNTGTANLTFRRCHLGRTVMGPEITDSAVLFEDCNLSEMLPGNRETGTQDDEDCLYIHDSGGRPVNLRRTVLSNCGDDALDCLAGDLTVEDCVIRNATDKGMSLLRNTITVRRTQIIDCDIGISSKTQEAEKGIPYTCTLEQVTIVCEEHPLNTSDGTFHSIGLHTRNKYGTTGANLPWIVRDCVISAFEPVRNDYGVAGNLFPQMTMDFTCFNDLQAPLEAVPAGTGNLAADPLYTAFAAKNFRLTALSPCRDKGDPAAPLEADGSVVDMGALPYVTAATPTGVLTWTSAAGPYRVTADVIVPLGLTLLIEPGVSVQFDLNKKITVNGTLKVLGSAASHVVFSHVPGAAPVDDPIVPGVQAVPPKWAGIVIQGPATGPISLGHEVRYADFINAQPVVAAANTGSLGIIRAEALVDHCTFTGTHLRQVYGRNCSVQVQYCVFTDPFTPGDATDNPVDYNLDNIAEPLKIENAAVAGDPNFTDGMANGGHFRVYYNDFYGNKGHNDVFDADAGHWPRSAVLDCRYNYFHGLTGDEHIDLGGDAYVASNIFERGHKDEFTNDHGYANAVSSGDKGSGSSIWVVRNLAFDLDHIMNCKLGTGAVVEHNTVANLHADFDYTSTAFNFTQSVKCSVINLYIPDDTNPTPGDGAYAGFNLLHNIPRVFSGADLPQPGKTSKLELFNNYLNGVTDSTVGAAHPGGLLSLGTGNVLPGNPLFVNEAARNYALKVESPARASGPGGLDYGASIAEWAFIYGDPAALTASTTATLTIGGPGVVAYKWRLDGGAWSAPIQIGEGGIFSRTAPMQRTAQLVLSNLASGPHTLEVLGQDVAGNWQDADPAKTAENQFGPTLKSWTVNAALSTVRLNEVLAENGTLPDSIELYNSGSAAVNIGGYSLSDSPLTPNKYVIPAGVTLAPGGFFLVNSTISGISLDKDGDAVYLRNGATLVDSVEFGHQLSGFSIGRIGFSGAWSLCTPTEAAANTAARLGDPAAVRISEWLASGAVLFSKDFVELANPGTLPVLLSGLRLTDNWISLPSQHIIAPLSFIGAGGYVKFIADGDAAAGPAHLSFSLDADQESIALANAGGALQDVIFFGPQTTDYSQGLGAAGLPAYYELPTPGLLNGTSDPAYANALALLHGLRLTEIMFNPLGGSDYEFLELRNVGAAALELGGVKLIKGVDFTFPAMTLGAGRNVVLVANLAKFRARYGNTPNVAGVYTGKLDNGGEGIEIQLPAPFDANILTFSYNNTWQPASDGAGKSLVVANPLTAASQWGDKDTWLASISAGGDPDGLLVFAPDHFQDWSTYYNVLSGASDADQDSLAATLEFALGLNPNSGIGPDGVASLPVAGVAANGRLELRLSLPDNLLAPQLHGLPEVTYVVQAADVLGNWATIATKTSTTAWTGPALVSVGASAGGRVPVNVQDPSVGDAPRFLRLRVIWAP